MEHVNAAWVDPETDYMQWLESQITLLRDDRFALLDGENLLIELGEAVLRLRRELAFSVRAVTLQLLRWEYEPARRSSQRRLVLEVQRQEIEVRLEESPSLGKVVYPLAQHEYPRAVRLAKLDTHLPAKAFPTELPYTRDQLLDPDFVPSHHALPPNSTGGIAGLRFSAL